MRQGGWDWLPIKDPSAAALSLCMWLIGVPVCLIVLFLALRPDSGRKPERIPEADFWHEPLPGVRFEPADFAALAGQRPNAARAEWSTTELPAVVVQAPLTDIAPDVPVARLWLRIHYRPPAGALPGERLALHVTRIMGGPYTVWVNGRLLHSNLDQWRMQWNIPLVVELPRDLSATRQPLDIELAVPYRTSQGYAVGSTYVGPLAAVQRMNDIRLVWQSSLPRAAILVALLLGLLALQFWFSLRSETGYLLLALTSVVWFVANTQYFGDFDDDLTSRWFGALNDAATSWLVPLITLFALRFEAKRWPRLELFLVVYAGVMSVWTLPIWNWQVYALALQHYVDLLVAFSTFVLLSWLAVRRGSHEFRVLVAAAWTVALLGLHDIYFLTSQRRPDGLHIFPYSTFALFGAFLYVMQRRYIGARRALEAANATLDQRLRQREAELEQKHRELLATEQQRVLYEERQRLMRDIHDGIGTGLMAALSMAEQHRLSPEHARDVLRNTLDELKLVIDSLEPVHRDVAALLASLRFRFGQRIEEAGIRIDWQVNELPPLPWLDPGKALQVLRFVQEAVTNVLKHARAGTLRIAASLTPDEPGRPASVLIVIGDDGIGFEPSQARRGRGLDNLRYRAGELHGELRIDSSPGRGTSVQLHLPVAPPPLEAA